MENEWDKIVTAGISFDLSNSFGGWRMEAAADGKYTSFIQEDELRFNIAGTMTSIQAVQFLRAYMIGYGNGLNEGRRDAREKMREALGL